MKMTKIIKGTFKERDIEIEGLWEEVSGSSWMINPGNAACIRFGMRCALEGLPRDDKVYYGKIGTLGSLVHESELEEKP